MRIDEDTIDRSAEEGARVIALVLLSDADEAADRFASAKDDEALHDFRVALRRLRSTLRAFRPWLEEDVRPRLEKKLRRCARSTNAARDAEVQLAWLRSKQDVLGSSRRSVGFEYVLERIEPRLHASDDATRVTSRYRRVAGKLARKLGTYQRRVDAGGAVSGPTFGGVLATLVTDQLEALRKRIDAVQGALDERVIHKARIEGKRLRYLLEPLRGNRHADSREAVRALKRLQEILGELHDTHVLGRELGDALAEVAVDRARELHRAVDEHGATGTGVRRRLSASPRPGILVLVRLLRERREALFADLEREWRAGGLDALTAEVQAITAALEARAGGKLELERKYLLAGPPPRTAEVPAVEIRQGWLPGTRFRERIRAIREGDTERFWRGLEHRAGRSRLEAEEETTREVFETLWPLTGDRRITKRRRRVKDGGLVWKIDEFVDRGLWIAEVEVPPRAADAPLPDWLRPLVLREVTDDPAYLNENLAVAPAPVPPAGPGDEERPPTVQ